MKNNLEEAISILKRLSEKGVEKALEDLRNIKQDDDKDKKAELTSCPFCAGSHVVRNGRKNQQQAYLCRDCKKSFVDSTNNVNSHSHFGEAVWKQVIRDTVNGVPIDNTASGLDISHSTVFNMRHKILYGLEQEEARNPTKFDGVCEMDETYVLESRKGKELPHGYYRKARKHGEPAAKPGLSDEYICVCAGVERNGGVLSKAVGRATAGTDDIREVFGDRVKAGTVIMADGLKGYEVLKAENKCYVFNTDKIVGVEHFHINTVNGFHSFIKERNRSARGYATKYLNRYCALFSKIYRSSEDVADEIYSILFDHKGRHQTIEGVKTENLLNI